MEFIGYAAAIFMGLSLGLIGGGGSILTVPILVYLFRLDPVVSLNGLFTICCWAYEFYGFIAFCN